MIKVNAKRVNQYSALHETLIFKVLGYGKC